MGVLNLIKNFKNDSKEKTETILVAFEKEAQNKDGKVEIPCAVGKRELQRMPCFSEGGQSEMWVSSAMDVYQQLQERIWGKKRRKKRERWGVEDSKREAERGSGEVSRELAGLGFGGYLKGGRMWKWGDSKGYTSSVKAGKTGREGLLATVWREGCLGSICS